MMFSGNRDRILHGLVVVVALMVLTGLLAARFTKPTSGHSSALSLPVAEGGITRRSADAAAPAKEITWLEDTGRPAVAARGGLTGPAPPAQGGMVAAIDPETGTLGPPSPDQAHAIASAQRLSLSRTPDGLVEIHRADGAVGIDLQGRFRDYAVVRMGPDGKPVLGCLHPDGRVTPAALDSISAPPALEER